MRRRGDLLAVTGLTKSFPGLRALANVSMTVGAHEIVAVLGENGSGKSTLVKVLAGIYAPDQGAVIKVYGEDGQPLPHSQASHAMHFIHQDLGLVLTLSAVENLDLGRDLGLKDALSIRGKNERTRARELIARFGGSFDVTTPLINLTASERTIVAIARALSGWQHAHQVLILDEPTAALHGPEVDRLFNAVRLVAAEGAGVLFISHRLDEVFSLADRLVVLRDGSVIADRQIDQIDERGLVSLIAGREIVSKAKGSAPTSEPVLEVRGLSGETVRKLDLTVGAGEVVGLAGLLGSGREHVGDLLFGVCPRTEGSVAIRGKQVSADDPRAMIRAGVGLVPGERLSAATFPNLSVRENMTIPRLGAFRRVLGRMDRRAEVREAKTWIGQLDIRPADTEKQISLLSGGNQQKVVLARWLRNDPDVLLLEEPTQGVDVGVKDTIYTLIRAVAAEGRAVLVISSDTKELALVCDRVIVMYEGLAFADLRGESVSEEALLTASIGLANQVRPIASEFKEETHA